MESLTHKAFAKFLGISSRTLTRHRDRIEAETGVVTTSESGNTRRYLAEHHHLYLKARDGNFGGEAQEVEIVEPTIVEFSPPPAHVLALQAESRIAPTYYDVPQFDPGRLTSALAEDFTTHLDNESRLHEAIGKKGVQEGTRLGVLYGRAKLQAFQKTSAEVDGFLAKLLES